MLKISPAFVAVAAFIAAGASMAAAEPSAVADLAPAAGNGAKGQVTLLRQR